MKSLFGINPSIVETPKARSNGSAKQPKGIGCEHCPANNVPGIRKIIGSIRGKKLLLWAQSPGPEENRQGMELVGRAGQWLWNEFAAVGIKREDCDIQNIVRCFPADRVDGGLRMRDPSKDELRCCSYFNRIAIEKSQAIVWAVFGNFAQEQLFGKKKRETVFYHNEVCVFQFDHPAYFIRGVAPEERFVKFRALMKRLAERLKTPGGRFDFLERKDYRPIVTGTQAVKAAKEILAIVEQTGERVAYDEEDDTIDGKRVILCVGACPKPGLSYVFILDHPENTVDEVERAKVRRVLKYLLEHLHLKTMQHGDYDARQFRRFLDADIQGFDYDTNYGEYINDPRQHEYNLTAMVNRKIPEFAGYKDIVIDAVPKGMTVEEGRDIGEFHLAKVPLKKLVLYNGADCDVTKQLEMGSKDSVPLPLVRVYTDAAFAVEEMQKFGPLLDYDHYAKMALIYPKKQDFFREKLRQMADDPDLNPNASGQITDLIYDTWGLAPVTKKPNSKKETLELLRYHQPHEGLDVLQLYREAKNRVERIASFKRSADAHHGRVTTYWWMTGAGTGRLSSGGGTRPDKRNLGNLQNIPKDAHIKNMLVSDLRWKLFVELALSEGLGAACREFSDLDLFVSCDYSQMELRILAQVTRDPEMIAVFKRGEDIHAAIGALWTGWSFEEIKKDEHKRTLVKELHFGVVYGLTPAGLFDDLKARGVKITQKEVEEYHRKYFERMKLVKAYIDAMPKFAARHGYVENLFGFKVPINVTDRPGPGPSWKNQAVNSPIQGAAHQVLLMAMALLKRNPGKYGLIKPQMEVHDNLVLISPLKDLKATIDVATELLEKDSPALAKDEFGIDWQIPFKVGTKIGFRFGGLVEITTTVEDALQEAVNKVAKQSKELETMQTEYLTDPVFVS